MNQLKQHSLFWLLFLCVPYLWGQKKSDLAPSSIDTLPKRFELDIPDLRDHIYEGIPQVLRNEKFPRKTYRFADLSSIQLANLFASGQLYSDWSALETYVNEIMRKVVPEVLREEEYLKVHLIKNGDFNAFMTPSGMMFINIGLFGDIEDEATLAAILAHEMAHYHLRHSINEYVKAERGEFKANIFYGDKNAYRNFSVNAELEADSLAFLWMNDSGYATEGLFEAFKISERQERQILAQYADLWEIEETTHPTSDKRLARLEQYAREQAQNQGARFLISQKKFQTFSKIAKGEILKYLLNTFDYISCIEKAFTFHIYDINEPTYVYYLLEAIRRAGYLDGGLWSKNFITFNYFKTVETDEGKKKLRRKDHLFTAFPYEILALREDAREKIQGQFYWDGAPKFFTFEQAFAFFLQIGELHEDPEFILTNALSFSGKEEVMKALLKKYLAQKNIKNRDFATKLLAGELKTSLKEEKLTVMSDFRTVVKQGKEEIPVIEKDMRDVDYLNTLMKTVSAGFDQRNFVLLAEMKYNQLNDYLLLTELERFSFLTLLARGQQTELFILDPRYWELMDRLQVNEIEFINCSYHDARKREYKLAPYQAITQATLESLFAEVKRYRYFEVLITSVRAIERKTMKTQYYGGEQKLSYKKPAHDQLAEIIRSKITHRDKEIKSFDAKMKRRMGQ